MTLKLKLMFEALRLTKKNGPKIAAALLIIILIPFMLIIMVVSVLFGWMGWFGDDEDLKLDPYITMANTYGLDWQELLAIDLAKHEMDQDELDPDELEDDFVYYIEHDVYKTDKKGNLVFDHTETVQMIRSFEEVMAYLKFTEEQRDMAMNALDSLREEYGPSSGGGTIGSGPGGGNKGLSKAVLAWEPLVRQEAQKHHLEGYVNIMLAQMQQESSGTLLDVMQVSEHLGLPPNTISDPVFSIQEGVKYFGEVLSKAKGDVKLALQSYNFGPGFMDYVKDHGGKYTKELAISFSNMMAKEMGWRRYGDVNYVDHVLRYVSGGMTDGSGSSGGTGVQKFNVNEVLSIMRKYDGWRYEYGERNPSHGAFDCSGLIEYSFGQIGINISGSAANQYNKTEAVKESEAQPGDLVFFDTDRKLTEKEKKNPDLLKNKPFHVSHVGIYIGDGKFYDANNGGVGESNLNTWRGMYRFLGFRRIQ